jgi:hypothetical protein
VRAIDALPDAQKWSLMERLYSTNACHFFMACRSKRPQPSYRVDWSLPASLDYAPEFRMRCGLEGFTVHRPGWQMPMDAAQLACVQQIDGRATLREIAANAVAAGVMPAGGTTAFVQALFQSLWQLDFVAMALGKL